MKRKLLSMLMSLMAILFFQNCGTENQLRSESEMLKSSEFGDLSFLGEYEIVSGQFDESSICQPSGQTNGRIAIVQRSQSIRVELFQAVSFYVSSTSVRDGVLTLGTGEWEEKRFTVIKIPGTKIHRLSGMVQNAGSCPFYFSADQISFD